MRTYFVDSFTSQKFKGNPDAVCIAESDLDSMTMQSVATEIGFSETAFIKKIDDGIYSNRFLHLKLKSLGHATLASSKIIFDTTTLQNIIFLNVEM